MMMIVLELGSKNQNVYDLINSDEDDLSDLIEKGDIEFTEKMILMTEVYDFYNKI